jgi:predicted GIY-YIG superfamily endonuclease
MDHVYWIRNKEDADISQHGYVGVSKDPARRLLSHRRHNENIPQDTWVEIVFSGTREECFEKEFELRPTKKMGWNRAVGGAQGFKIGFSHSEKTRQKLKNAWTPERKKKASVWKTEQNVLLTGQKRPAQSHAISGENNPMFGKTHSIAAREKIREANLGRPANNMQDIFCIFCRERAPLSILKKYHGIGKKNCC